MQKQPLIRIVDDDPNLLKALSFMLKLEGWQVRTYSSAEEYIREDAPSVPGCLILDVRMPGMSGISLQDLLIERKNPIPIIFLSGHGDIDMAVDAMRHGAVTFLQKPVNDEKLLTSIAEAVRLDAEKRFSAFDCASAQRKYSHLTEREKEIVRWVLKGKTNRDISFDLDISERTVETHRASAYKKLEVKSAAELMQLCQNIDL